MENNQGTAEIDSGVENRLQSGFSQFGSRNLTRVRTSHFARRNISFKQMEAERKEVEEIQEAMREMDVLGKLLFIYSIRNLNENICALNLNFIMKIIIKFR